MDNDQPYDLDFPAESPAVLQLRRKYAKAMERAEQLSDDLNEGPLWDLDREQA